MLSTRSLNSEAVNDANPLGYHMGQGTLYSYVTGNEYKDIMGAWDWNLVPGTTVLLNKPKLQQSVVGFTGKRNFVGVVSDGLVGTAVQDYVDPYDASLSFRKAWFFLDDSVLVTTSNVQINTSVPGAADSPAITVLDNRAAVASPIWVDDKQVTVSGGATAEGSTLYYGGNGYLSYKTPFSLTLTNGPRTGNWSAISTSTLGETTVPIFSAYTTIPHDTHTYALFPATSRSRLAREATNPSSAPVSGPGITGVAGSGRLSLVFWPGGDRSITVDLAAIGWAEAGSVTVASDQPGAYLFSSRCKRAGRGMRLAIALSDPTQKVADVGFSLTFEGARVKQVNAGQDDGFAAIEGGARFDVKMPEGGLAGSSVSRNVFLYWT